MAVRELLPVEKIEFAIPIDLLKEFQTEDLRIIIRHPWVIGIPVPELWLRNPELLGRLTKQFEVMLVPRQVQR